MRSPNQTQWPRLLKLAPGQPLVELVTALKSPEMPCVDLDVVLEQIVDALLNLPTADSELLDLPSLLLGSEYLSSRAEYPSKHRDFSGDNFSDDVFALERVAHLARQLGMSLKSLFKAYRLFEEDYLKYEYSGILDERFVILRIR